MDFYCLKCDELVVEVDDWELFNRLGDEILCQCGANLSITYDECYDDISGYQEEYWYLEVVEGK